MFLTKIGKIWYLYYTNKSTGKRNKISTKCKLRNDAETFKENFEFQNNPLSLGKKIRDNPHTTLSQLRDYAILYFSKQNYKFNQKLFSNGFNKFISYQTDKVVDTLTPLDIENWKMHRVEQVSKTTVNIEFRAFKALFNKAITWGLITTNPCTGIKQFSVAAKERLTFETKDLNKIISLMQEFNPKLVEIVKFGFMTGARLNEILHLQWSDIDLKNRTITIRNKSNFQTKSRKLRTIPISDNLQSLFNQMLLKDGVMKLYDISDYVFTKENSKFPYDKCYVSRKFKHYLRKAGLPEKFHFHCLRHTFATNFLQASNNIYYAKEILGHSDIKTTTLYLHTDNNSLLNAMNLMSASN